MSDSDLQAMQKTSHLSGQSANYIESLYESYSKDPSSVTPEWQQYFATLPKLSGNSVEISHAEVQQEFLRLAAQPRQAIAATPAQWIHAKKQAHVLQLINAYRAHGHHEAKLDPLNLVERKSLPDLDLAFHQLGEEDLATTFSSESALSHNGAKLSVILEGLRATYCSSIGVEFMHISDSTQVQWIATRMETARGKSQYSAAEKKSILSNIVAAEGLEKYLGTRFVGQKRFSLEGCDSLIPMMQHLLQHAGAMQMKEAIIGMAHRGRLNLLVNVLGKRPEDLFREFEGKITTSMSGDVKYHLGFSSDVKTPGGFVHLALAFNPSHLEIVAPVVEGSVRVRQYRRNDLVDRKQVVPIVMHGDAAFAGQGVVMETFNFSNARGYATGGTIHIVINNQIGFTTSNPLDARSTLYCTDVAKMVQAPIFHVNADDPEAVLFVSQLAYDFRNAFHKDVVIDLVCYRRHGHNEADEPAITQPIMYQAIKNLPTVLQLYSQQLIRENVVTANEVEAMVIAYRDKLDRGEPIVETFSNNYDAAYAIDWAPYENQLWTGNADTTLPIGKIRELAQCMDTFPDHFVPHPVVKRMWEERRKMTAGEIPLNWGYAETLAYATLVDQEYMVRLSGQDCGRGTFAHRHAVLYDFNTGDPYIPLEHISKNQSPFNVIDSVLSEEAVLAFEYGYAASEPNALVIWEAQFGDFVNGAQVVIDQFISSGEQKWGRLCGLTMFLPHGYEGMGPEHTSARLERFLQLCAEHNMQVCIPTTPAQIYHLIRRQMIRPYRKPLIVMTPKSLLRHKLAVSTLEDLASGTFQNVIPEIDAIAPEKCRRVILCSGKVYYDLLEKRREQKIMDVAIIRIEQLYPFPQTLLKQQLSRYAGTKDIVWCQEEPQNQGAWFSSQHHMVDCLQPGQELRYVGRDFFASPAVGYLSLHLKQQAELVQKALI